MSDEGKDEAFVNALKQWRDLRGLSQSRLARIMRYDRSYISKIESGQERPSLDFARRADVALEAGGGIRRAYKIVSSGEARHQAFPHTNEELINNADSLVVEIDDAELVWENGIYRANQYRRIYNGTEEPITRYMIRISVDRYPGDPSRSNELYRKDPLTWPELNLEAHCGEERMQWVVEQDWDAFKEVWLLFENDRERFPLYPGESTEIRYSYSVSARKWGQWFQRAVRLPTKYLAVRVDFPASLEPTVWGMETSMANGAVPVKTPIHQRESSGRVQFSWSTDYPALHSRFRLEWRLLQPEFPTGDSESIEPHLRSSDSKLRSDNAVLAQRFDEQRVSLREIATRLLGSEESAEEALQETWARVNSSPLRATNVSSWLRTTMTRVCLDMLISDARSQIDSADPQKSDISYSTLLTQAIRPALNSLLDSLPAQERLAFLLHHMFAMSFEEIADTLACTPTTARHLDRQARLQIKGTVKSSEASPTYQRHIVEAFLSASYNNDLEPLLVLLDPDAELHADDIASTSLRITSGKVHGAVGIAQVFSRLGLAGNVTPVDGTIGAIWILEGKRIALAFTITGGKISTIDAYHSPSEGLEP